MRSTGTWFAAATLLFAAQSASADQIGCSALAGACPTSLVGAAKGAPPYPVRGRFQWITADPVLAAGDWNSPTVSDDGVFVAAAGDTFSGTSYRFNRTAPSVTYVEVGGAGANSLRPRISGDGRYVVFESRVSFGEGGTVLDVFVWDGQTGSVKRASVPTGGSNLDADAFSGDISRDGRYVTFLSQATNAAPGATQAGRKVFRADLSTPTASVVLASGTITGAESARVSHNGRFVAFRAGDDLFVSDMQGGTPVPANLTASTTDLLADAEHSLSFSPDGRFVAQSMLVGDSFRTLVFDRLVAGSMPRLAASDNQGSVAVSSGSGFVSAATCVFASAYSAHVGVSDRAGNEVRIGVGDGTLETCEFGIDVTAKGDLVTVSLPPLVDPDFGLTPAQEIYAVTNPLYQPLPRSIAQYQGGIPASSSNVKASGNGRLAVFQSEIPAEQLLCYDADAQVYTPGCAPADTNGRPDVFRYDSESNSVELVSSVDGLTAIGGSQPDIDLSGERIVFQTLDSGVVAKQLRDGKDYGLRSQKATITSVFLAQLVSGASQRSITRMSVGRNGAMPNGNSQNASISANGMHVSYSTDANNINPGSDLNGVRDVVTVATGSGTVDCVSACPGRNTTAPSDWPSVSNDGKVAMETEDDSLGGTSPFPQIAVFDPHTRLAKPLSVTGGGVPGSGPSRKPRIASSGSAVVYQSTAPDLTVGDANGRSDVFLATVIGGANQRVSRKPPPGGKANAQAPRAKAGVEDGDSLQPTISGDGRFVAFQTTATNLVDIDGNGVTDIIVADVRSGELRRIYQGFGGVESDGASETPHLNHNGRHLGFHSFATNLSEVADTNVATSEPYVRDNPQAAEVLFFDAFE